MRRRDFIATGLASGAALGLAGPAAAGAGSIHRTHNRPLKILFLGGTGFVGPVIVDLALERGHDVTLFNRGRTNPWLFTCLEKLRGDRNAADGLSALAGDRTWDAVIDTWQDSPLSVAATARLLRDRANAYVYISSIAVYQGQNYQKRSFDEDAPLPAATMPDTPARELDYAKRKQLGEQVVRESFARRAIVTRSYEIVGLDPHGRLEYGIPYWPARVLRGGRILAPGDGTDRLQWTDARDLAAFTVHALENEIHGTYNLSTGTTFRNYLESLAEICRNDVLLQWAPARFLFDKGLESFTDVPSWVWSGEFEKGFYGASTERSLEAGCHPRSIRETFRPITDALQLHYTNIDLTAETDGFEIARRESELLRAWDETNRR